MHRCTLGDYGLYDHKYANASPIVRFAQSYVPEAVSYQKISTPAFNKIHFSKIPYVHISSLCF